MCEYSAMMGAMWEAKGKGRKTVKAQKWWFRILETQIEAGAAFIVLNGHAKRESNRQNLRLIHISNF